MRSVRIGFLLTETHRTDRRRGLVAFLEAERIDDRLGQPNGEVVIPFPDTYRHASRG